ncbi:hypothetical protein QVD17_27560 [Tagetes erecta]|uniref:PGG domain-containing protein n=1 Tax=Tagetes erecta TaxID=13708 RepID=A0AAD8KBM9_TARER|nr:hypothetical protein QVD17_27560 [Tagetes erecta]
MEVCSSANMSAAARIHDFEYLYASNTNVSNFVSVKLSGTSNYLVWKAQMLCLLDSNNMCGIVDEAYVGPKDSGSDHTMRQYDSLAKGWILGSVNEDVLGDVYSLGSAKAVWEKLKSLFDPAMCLQGDSTSQKSSVEAEEEEIEIVSAETTTVEEVTNSLEIIVGEEIVSTETTTKDEEDAQNKKVKHKRKIHAAIIKGDWLKVGSILEKDECLATEAISSDGSTVLHIAVGIGHNDIIKLVLPYIEDELELKTRNSDGSTALHIAAIVGNKQAAELLVKTNNKFLVIQDSNGKLPLDKAYENMHLDTVRYLLKAVNDDTITELHGHVHPDDDVVLDLLVNAISAKHYGLASELVQKIPQFASKSEDVLMSLAKTFPTGLNYGETLLYPSMELTKEMADYFDWLTDYASSFPSSLMIYFFVTKDYDMTCSRLFLCAAFFIITVGPCIVVGIVTSTIRILIYIVGFVIFGLHWVLWKSAHLLAFAPVKHIENKYKEWEDAKEVLELVCNEIDKLDYNGTHHPYYTQPILEAACQNAFKVVDEILFRSPEVIQSTDKNGYDIIQLAIIHRSEKVYNLIYDVGERMNLYRTIVDSSKNNVLHLAGKLAPSNVLNRRTGAALQLQRELQWHEEVKKLVFPTYITQENIFKETPGMVFTREHENLVKEGEQWMKTTAESCSITAALITTIVFAAAITVPGGSNQETGMPLFKKKSAFIIFAISDAISLFASSTALLVFLSILTARFAEKDFLVSLPRRLFIGLFCLLLSTTAMMVAFSATLFLVFCEQKLWMLAPICGLAFIPIAFFVTLQFPLMVDLFRSTYLRIFGKQRKSVIRRFNPNDIRLLFGK